MQITQKNWQMCLIVALALVGIVLSAQSARAAGAVWLEGETPDKTTLDVKTDSWGPVLSGGKWLHYSLNGGDVDKQVPETGIVLSYNFVAPAAGHYELWNRVGYEAVRSAFEWHVDDGAWKTITNDHPSTDLVELAEWNPAAWLEMGEQDLTGGNHILQIRLAKSKNDKGETNGIQYASDALAISPTPFRPNEQYKPDDTSWQSAQDKDAATKVFEVAAPQGAAQTSFSLKGLWQLARYDEGKVDAYDGPIQAPPAADSLFWKFMNVPGNRNGEHPEWTYSHRYFLRTRVNLPSDAANHSWVLHFPSINLIATVFVNGQSCGTTKTPFAVWDCDVSKAIKPGLNEVWVGIKDTYYARPLKTVGDAQYVDYLPTTKVAVYGPDSFTFPIWGHYETGILQEPTLVCAGKAYTSDVFAIPSVKNKTLGLEVTLNNPTNAPMAVSVQNAVEPLAGGAAEKTFAPQTVTVAPNSQQVVRLSEAWANPKLWWPDDPQQYTVVTRLVADGQTLDERHTKFGFREWEWAGRNFRLNGVNWFGRADTASFAGNGADDLKALKAHGETMIRLWGEGGWHEYGSPDAALDFFDAHGMPIRRTGIFDGEGAKYYLTEEITGADGKKQQVARRALFDNWRNQLLAWAKGQRNHPSIFVWSMENEITFINSSVFGLNPLTDPEMKRAATELAVLDPTRPQMTDGGNALLDDSLPIYGIHYIEGAPQQYPQWGYDLDNNKAIEHAQKWPISSPNKPLFFGETFYAPGYNLSQLAAVGGESTLLGKAEARQGVGLIGKMMSEGYRWSGVGAFHFWEGNQSDLYYNSWQPIAVLCRQWDWTFGSGDKVKRTLGIFNDTRFEQPLTLTLALEVEGKAVGQQTSQYKIEPGQNQKFDVTLALPKVVRRSEGHWVLTLASNGKQVFKDTKELSILPTPALPTLSADADASPKVTTRANAEVVPPGKKKLAPKPAKKPASAAQKPATSTSPPKGAPSPLLVFDPQGNVAAFLKARAIAFTSLSSLDNLPSAGKILVVGKDAIDAPQSTSSGLAAWAASGRSVIVLEQKNPLRYQALPGEMTATKDTGYLAFPEDLEHPAFAGLRAKDFSTWGPGDELYVNAYQKPTSGARSLLQCGDGLGDTALAEVPAGKGLMLLSQLLIGEKIGSNAVAQQMLFNLIRYGALYRQTFRAVTVDTDYAPLIKSLDAAKLQYTKANNVLAAIAQAGSVAVINATPDNLKTLAANLPKVNAFTQGGGWIVFNNLTPEGLADYNKIVGVDHLIRKFGREKVTFPAQRNPLTSGLSTSSIVMGSGKRIFDWQAGDYPAEDAYSYVVDYDDVAPFAKSSFFAYSNITNNFTNADGWPLIINFPAPGDGKPYGIPISLPRPETITEFKWIGNTNYFPETKLNLLFDGANPLPLDVEPNGDPQTFEIEPPRAAKDMTLQLTQWQTIPGMGSNLGIDNIYLKAKRSPEFYQKVKPMLNIGALMEYPRGAGGMVLCNVNFQDSETVPENMDKKRAIITTILQNLKAPFSGGKSIIAGANLLYTPIDLSRQANAYRNEQGWFGDKDFSFKGLPTGKQKFAGVSYSVYDFATSPVPTALVLGGNGVPGNLADHVNDIPVNQKADALFFLQAARIDQRRNNDDIKNGRQFEMARYVVHYADGQTANVPVYSEVNVDNFKQSAPVTAVPGAQIAWTAPYEGTDQNAVAYSMQWNNPRPEVPIQSIDFQYGNDRRGIPALLAITAATGQ